MISDVGAFMKQIIIIAGGIISLTIMIAIFVAILVVSVFKEDTVAAWNNMLLKTPQHKSTICFLLSKVSVMMSWHVINH